MRSTLAPSLPGNASCQSSLSSTPSGTQLTLNTRAGRVRFRNQWTLSGEAFSMQTMKPMMTVHEGRRYRIKFRNASDDVHPLHLHLHCFELTQIGGRATEGVVKDVVMLGGFRQLALDFVEDNPGLTLFHCYQQLHMDFGFMALFNYA
jgi:FtsP/CotA-like multicopper oxidase with cupredoxin domain